MDVIPKASETTTSSGAALHRRDLTIITLLLAFPSCGFVQKYTGLPGVTAYIAMVAILVVLTARLGTRIATWLRLHFRKFAALAVIGLAAGYVALHPLEDQRGPGRSSDRDEGLELAVHRMTEGKTPYYPSNQVAGPLSVLPGSIALSAPFVAMGNIGYQNIFWLAAFLLVSSRLFKDGALALCLLVIPLALSPAAQYELISGGDLIANGIFVAIFLILALWSWLNPSSPVWHRWLACLLVGVGFASRANFILLVPLFGAAIWRVAGPRQAFAATALVVLATATITLPFYLHDPAGFTPLLSRQKLAVANQSLPWAGNAMIGVTTLTALFGACVLLFRQTESLIGSVFRWCAVVTLTPMVCAVILSSWVLGHLSFGFLLDRFGLMYVFFALVGWGGRWIEDCAAGSRGGTLPPGAQKDQPSEDVAAFLGSKPSPHIGCALGESVRPFRI